jgi:hypothetical protein
MKSEEIQKFNLTLDTNIFHKSGKFKFRGVDYINDLMFVQDASNLKWIKFTEIKGIGYDNSVEEENQELFKNTSNRFLTNEEWDFLMQIHDEKPIKVSLNIPRFTPLIRRIEVGENDYLGLQRIREYFIKNRQIDFVLMATDVLDRVIESGKN